MMTLRGGVMMTFTVSRRGNFWTARSASGRTTGIARNRDNAIARLADLCSGALYLGRRF